MFFVNDEKNENSEDLKQYIIIILWKKRDLSFTIKKILIHLHQLFKKTTFMPNRNLATFNCYKYEKCTAIDSSIRIGKY